MVQRVKKAFTLIELLAVVVIIAVLIAIIVPIFHRDTAPAIKGTETIAASSRVIIQNGSGETIYDSQRDGKYNIQWGN